MSLNVILDSSIMVKGQPATAGSKMLADFIAPFSATVVERLEAAGVSIAGRVESSEFGVGGLFGDEERGAVSSQAHNDIERAFSLVLNGETDFALFNDYTGAVSRAAASCGLYYIHPSYGSVSRYGLIPSVTSMDQIGIVCKSPEVGFQALRLIAGYDSRDGVMLSGEGAGESKGAEEPSPCFEIDVVALETDYSDVFPQVMQILCCAELGNNISRYDGIRYGFRAKDYNGLNELYTKSRTEAFGADVKLAAILGAMVLSQENYARYYDKAMRLRRLIRDSLDFDSYDVIVTKCPILSRLCGLPSLTTPEHVYVASAGCEDVLEAASKAVKSGDKAFKDDEEFKGQIKAVRGEAL